MQISAEHCIVPPFVVVRSSVRPFRSRRRVGNERKIIAERNLIDGNLGQHHRYPSYPGVSSNRRGVAQRLVPWCFPVAG